VSDITIGIDWTSENGDSTGLALFSDGSVYAPEGVERKAILHLAQQLADKEEECERLRGALEGLLEDTQHAEHDCVDKEHCPVLYARKVLEGKDDK
tara:strand:+ start:3178 stop:3465 length:288 start_codon:yes stop_codon:yes gene_type:complete